MSGVSSDTFSTISSFNSWRLIWRKFSGSVLVSMVIREKFGSSVSLTVREEMLYARRENRLATRCSTPLSLSTRTDKTNFSFIFLASNQLNCSIMSVCAPPGGIIGSTLLSGEIRQSTNTGPG